MKGMGAEADKKCWTEGRVMKENERKFGKAGAWAGFYMSKIKMNKESVIHL